MITYNSENFSNLLDVWEWVVLELPEDEEVWAIARESADIPEFEDIYQDLLLTNLKNQMVSTIADNVYTLIDGKLKNIKFFELFEKVKTYAESNKIFKIEVDGSSTLFKVKTSLFSEELKDCLDNLKNKIKNVDLNKIIEKEYFEPKTVEEIEFLVKILSLGYCSLILKEQYSGSKYLEKLSEVFSKIFVQNKLNCL